MKVRARPDQIDSILNSMGHDDETMIELQTYIADLEAKQPDRPTRITSLLQEVASRCSAEARVSLEVYITQLEANQLVAAPQSTLPSSRFDPENPPHWSHQRAVEREQRRRARALRKQNHYQ